MFRSSARAEERRSGEVERRRFDAETFLRLKSLVRLKRDAEAWYEAENWRGGSKRTMRRSGEA